MEKEGYRENIELLMGMFPGKAVISVKETAAALGVDIRTVYSNIKRVHDPMPSQRCGKRIVIPLPGLARWMCG